MDSVGLYLKELKNKNSTHEESFKLIELAKAGDENAKETLIKNYLLLVVKISREYMNKGVPLADIISEGNLGLIKSLEKFDASKGVPFASYTKYWIKQSIIRNCMHNNRLVKLPENVSELMKSDRWEGPNFREVSIDTPNDDGDSMADSIPDLDSYDKFSVKEENMILKSKVEKILSFLSERDANIVRSYYGIGMANPLDLQDAAACFNLTTTRINQILRNSLKHMRVSHQDQPETKIKDIEIVSATYGIDGCTVDVTDKVVDLYLRKENIKSCNKLGGDPCPGIAKILSIQYIFNEDILTKNFNEGTLIKF